MRISIYRPFLHNPASAGVGTGSQQNQPNPAAETVTTIAKDTIRVLRHINNTTDIYRTQQMMFNHFLLSAMAVIFLAVSHSPGVFAESCREEFYMALDLVRGLSKDSIVSRRLWRMVKGMRDVAPKLGLVEGSVVERPAGDGNRSMQTSSTAPMSGTVVQHHRTPSQSRTQRDDPHSSAAMAMAGLAGHNIDESILYSLPNFGANGNPGGGSSMAYTPSSTVLSPGGMANELTNLFEAAGDGFQGFFGAGVGAGGGEDELSRIMRDLF